MVNIAEADGNGADLADWATSTRLAYQLGEEFSQHLPISSTDRFSDGARVYRGPVVAVVNTDHLLLRRPVRGQHRRLRHWTDRRRRRRHRGWRREQWTSDDIQYAYHAARLPLPPIPPGISYTVSVRRMTRSGDSVGLAVEDIGVSGDERYDMTETDLTDGNTDLAEFCTNLLTAT